MPELPEVETVRRGLAPILVGHRIIRLAMHRPDLRRAMPRNLSNAVTGRRVEALERRAKYLLARLDGGQTLIVHLGMTGRWFVSAADRPRNIHDHVVMDLDDGTHIVFNDARRFGHIDLVKTPADLIAYPPLMGLGPEPLDDAFDGGVLYKALATRRTSLKALLMDQKRVAGLGNIYVCEALFRARLNPAKSGTGVTKKQANLLAASIKAVLTEAIESGGSTLRDYVNAAGAAGYFQHRFDVYDREGKPCVNDASHTICRIAQGGRSTFYCPVCQR
jgi:formamidopyrimidine-DNA glycosylase